MNFAAPANTFCTSAVIIAPRGEHSIGYQPIDDASEKTAPPLREASAALMGLTGGNNQLSLVA
jgi:hypothetical protein